MQLESWSSYNPLSVQSGLYSALCLSSNKRGSLSKTQRTFSGNFQTQVTLLYYTYVRSFHMLLGAHAQQGLQ